MSRYDMMSCNTGRLAAPVGRPLLGVWVALCGEVGQSWKFRSGNSRKQPWSSEPDRNPGLCVAYGMGRFRDLAQVDTKAENA